jgi:hypothetical protein
MIALVLLAVVPPVNRHSYILHDIGQHATDELWHWTAAALRARSYAPLLSEHPRSSSRGPLTLLVILRSAAAHLSSQVTNRGWKLGGGMTKRPRYEKNRRNSPGVALALMSCGVLVALAMWAPVARVQLIVSGLPTMLAIATVCLTSKRLKLLSLEAVRTNPRIAYSKRRKKNGQRIGSPWRIGDY